MNYLRGEVQVTIEGFGKVRGTVLSVSKEDIMINATEILSPTYLSAALPYGVMSFKTADICDVEDIPELTFFAVNWYDSELDEEDSEVIEARTQDEAIQIVMEGNRFAEDIQASEYVETVYVA